MGEQRDVDTAEIELPPLDTPALSAARRSLEVKVEFGAASHPGKIRTSNEDHYLIFRLGRALDTLASNLPRGEIPDHFAEHGYALAVADGMGGMAGGEVASRMALKSGVEYVLNEVKWNFRAGEREAQEIMDNMNQYVRSLDFTLTEQARFDKSLAGMGTTLTVAYTVGADLFGIHVGDSRLYVFRQGQLLQLTRDHTVAQSLADSGMIAPGDVATHRQRHVLTSAVGGNAGLVKADALRFRLQDGDRLLLCTDGLTDLVADARIARLLEQQQKSQDVCDSLVTAVLDAGGRDNVTVVVAHYTIPAAVTG